MAKNGELYWRFVEMHGPVMPAWMCAWVLGVSRRRVYQLIERGQLHRVNVAGAVCVMQVEVRKRYESSKRFRPKAAEVARLENSD